MEGSVTIVMTKSSEAGNRWKTMSLATTDDGDIEIADAIPTLGNTIYQSG